jgi:hypothetical protein
MSPELIEGAIAFTKDTFKSMISFLMMLLLFFLYRF